MNGAVLDTTFNFFFKFKYAHTFDAMLATPLGVARRGVGRDAVGAAARHASTRPSSSSTMAVLGLVDSWWALLALPAAVLIVGSRSPARASAATTFMRSWIDFDYVNLALIPLFLFSATFFPLVAVPRRGCSGRALTPLYQGVALERGLILGHLDLDPAPERRSTSPSSAPSASRSPPRRLKPPPALTPVPEVA